MASSAVARTTSLAMFVANVPSAVVALVTSNAKLFAAVISADERAEISLVILVDNAFSALVARVTSDVNALETGAIDKSTKVFTDFTVGYLISDVPSTKTLLLLFNNTSFVASAVVARVTSVAKSFAIVPSAVVALTTSFVIFTVNAASAAALVVASDAIELVKAFSAVVALTIS